MNIFYYIQYIMPETYEMLYETLPVSFIYDKKEFVTSSLTLYLTTPSS